MRRSAWLRLVLPLALSLSPWVCLAAILRYIRDDRVEGAYLVLAFLGALAFAFTGPAIVVALYKSQDETFENFGRFVRLFFLLSSPVLAFQVFIYSTSILSVFIDIRARTSADMLGSARAALVAVIIYGAYAAALYALAQRSFRSLLFGATLLSCALLAAIAFRIV